MHLRWMSLFGCNRPILILTRLTGGWNDCTTDMNGARTIAATKRACLDAIVIV